MTTRNIMGRIGKGTGAMLIIVAGLMGTATNADAALALRLGDC